MKQKLESLKDFQSNSLNAMAMIDIRGGFAANTVTGAGSVCVPNSQSSTGCMSYSSDNTDTSGNTSSTIYYGSSDINGQC